MQFYLTYEGPIYSGKKSRADHKQEIRRVFHKQLKTLWQTDMFLSNVKYGVWEKHPEINSELPLAEGLAQQYQRGLYRFVPLVRAQATLLCSLKILFLRPELPGSMIDSGDIDGRLKILFDGLKMPQNDAELGEKDGGPGDGEDPFFVLLEDDKLVSHVSVETGMLFQPTSETLTGNALKADARVVIDVNVRPSFVTWSNIGFAN